MSLLPYSVGIAFQYVWTLFWGLQNICSHPLEPIINAYHVLPMYRQTLLLVHSGEQFRVDFS